MKEDFNDFLWDISRQRSLNFWKIFFFGNPVKGRFFFKMTFRGKIRFSKDFFSRQKNVDFSKQFLGGHFKKLNIYLRIFWRTFRGKIRVFFREDLSYRKDLDVLWMSRRSFQGKMRGFFKHFFGGSSKAKEVNCLEDLSRQKLWIF